MMRRFLALVLLAATVHAADVTTHLVVPGYGGQDRQRWSDAGQLADEMRCWTIPAPLGITNATQFAGVVNCYVNAVFTAGLGVYPDSDGGSAYGVGHYDCTTSGGGHTLYATGLTPFSLTQGDLIRVCTCLSARGYWQDAGGYVANMDNALFGEEPRNNVSVFNQWANRGAIVTNPCVSGIPPATTGAYGTKVTSHQPLVVIE